MTNALYNAAELALAAYGPLRAGPTALSLGGLDAAGLVLRQRREFALRYPDVVTQFNDTATGFSATVFKHISGNISLAIRGTEQLLSDGLTDSDIAFLVTRHVVCAS